MNRTQRSFNVNENYEKSYKRFSRQISSNPLETTRLSTLFIRSVVVFIIDISYRLFSCFLHIAKEVKSIMALKNGQKFNHNTFNSKPAKMRFVRFGNTTCLYSANLAKKGVFK